MVRAAGGEAAMRLILGLVLAFLWAGTALAQPRLALVIGNQDYANVPKLRNATADAQAVAAVLRERGFEVTEGLNLDRRALLRTFEEFRAKVRAGSVVVFYYAGHGVQVDGANYLLPVDIERRSERDAAYDALSLNLVTEKLAAQNSARERGLNLLIIDACRDNPFRFSRGGDGNGLAAKPASGLMTLYAAGTGQSALDRLSADDPDPNGVFTRFLLRAMRTPGLAVREMATRVKLDVAQAARSAGQQQLPAFYDEAEGDFTFTPGPAAPAMPAAVAAAPPPLTAPDRPVAMSPSTPAPAAPRQPAPGTLPLEAASLRNLACRGVYPHPQYGPVSIGLRFDELGNVRGYELASGAHRLDRLEGGLFREALTRQSNAGELQLGDGQHCQNGTGCRFHPIMMREIRQLPDGEVDVTGSVGVGPLRSELTFR